MHNEVYKCYFDVSSLVMFVMEESKRVLFEKFKYISFLYEAAATLSLLKAEGKNKASGKVRGGKIGKGRRRSTGKKGG